MDSCDTPPFNAVTKYLRSAKQGRPLLWEEWRLLQQGKLTGGATWCVHVRALMYVDVCVCVCKCVYTCMSVHGHKPARAHKLIPYTCQLQLGYAHLSSVRKNACPCLLVPENSHQAWYALTVRVMLWVAAHRTWPHASTLDQLPGIMKLCCSTRIPWFHLLYQCIFKVWTANVLHELICIINSRVKIWDLLRTASDQGRLPLYGSGLRITSPGQERWDDNMNMTPSFTTLAW